jgi:hypothetical protein
VVREVVVRRETAAEAWLRLVCGLFAAVWRWRLELGRVVVPVVAWRLLGRSLGSLPAAGVVVVTAAVVLGVPGSRGALVRWLRSAHVRRRWRRAWVDVGLPRVAARRVSWVPAGELVRIQCSRGSSIPEVEAQAERLAACLAAREVRVGRDPRHAG